MLNAAAYYPIYFGTGQIFVQRPLFFNQWQQKDPGSNEAPESLQLMRQTPPFPCRLGRASGCALGAGDKWG